tara:strand:+ start:667 stop:1482 length:816 start_codon:yes stop_codon:yes gene_type:complete
MADQQLRQAFTRTGSKQPILDKVYKLFPDDFKTYVEPFIGGGSVMMAYPFKKDQKIVINDKDELLIDQYRFVKSNPSMEGTDIYDTRDIRTLTKLRDYGEGRGGWDGYVSYVINQRNTFMSTGGKGQKKLYKKTSPSKNIKLVPLWAQKLKHVTILNKNYIDVIKHYDSPTTFFYLDPPYEKSGSLYKDPIIDYNEMVDVLLDLKGKFLLSINNSPYIRKTFKDFDVRSFIVSPSKSPVSMVRLEGLKLGGRAGQSTVGTKERKEFFIKNY